MPSKDFTKYPMNLLLDVFKDSSVIPNYPELEQYVDLAVDHVAKEFPQAKEFVELRYRENMTLAATGAAMRFATRDRIMQICYKFFTLIRRPRTIAMIKYGSSWKDEWLKGLDINEITNDYMEINPRTSYALVRHMGIGGPREIEYIKAGHIIQLFRTGEIYHIRGIGRKTIDEILIPKLLELGIKLEDLM